MLTKFKPNKPYSEEEAIFAGQAQEEIGQAIAALLSVVFRGTCNKKLPKKIMALA